MTTNVHMPNSTLIGLAVFAWVTVVSTERQRDHGTCDICSNRPHPYTMHAVWHKIKYNRMLTI